MASGQHQKGQVRAGCYCRISSDPKDKREGVDRQRADTTALCEVKGWNPAGFYIDNDRSASNGHARPEWDRLLADIKAGKIDAIAAWDQDRGWRMMHELEELRKFFTGLGREIKLATTGQGDIDLYTPTGVLAVQIKTAVSEHEIAMMKVRQRRAARAKAEQGRPQWKRSFGYLPDTRRKEDDDGTRAIDEDKAELVRQAYDMIRRRKTLREICELWNEAGAYTAHGKPWTAPQMSNFLRKPRNAGLRSHNGEIVAAGLWEPLVDEDTWRKAQVVLNEPKRRPGKKTVQRHLLTGVLLCGKPGCGHYLSGQHTPKNRHGNTAIVYACKSCRGVSIRAEFAVPYVYGLVIERLSREDAKDLLKAEIHDAAEAEAIRTELNDLYQELENIGIERGQRLLTGPQAKIATDLISADIAKLERRQQSAERLRVFEGLELGSPEVETGIRALSPDRFRAVVDVLMTLTVQPVGKGHRVNGDRFDPNRVHAAPK